MWLLILICIGECSGAPFTEARPLIMVAPSQLECYYEGLNKAAVFRHWTNYSYAYHCAEPANVPPLEDNHG